METYHEILERMQNAFYEEAGFSADDASDIGIRLKVLAGEIFSLYNGMEWISRQCFAQTAVGESLDLHAGQRGLVRKEAVPAGGALLFSRATGLRYDVQIPKGTVCAAQGDSSTRFVTTEDAVLPSQELSVLVPAEAQQGGKDTNAAAEKITVLVTPPAGIEAVTNPEPFTGGMNAETDEELRKRILDSYAEISNGTNAEFYRKRALQHEGVYSAGVIARENGAGTVSVYLAGQGGPVSTAVAQEVQKELSQLREINVDVTVSPAVKKECTLLLGVTPKPNTSLESAKTVIQDAVKDYFSKLGVGQDVLMVEIGKLLLETGMIYNYKITDSDKVIADNQIAVLDTVTVMELT